MRILITGGAGFIGSNFVHHVLRQTDWEIVVIDALTYAGRMSNLGSPCRKVIAFEKLDIRDQAAVSKALERYNPEYIVHFAAESHVCRSISGPKDFMTTNILGTFNLLEESRRLKKLKKFIHISTDEVFGEILPGMEKFNETSRLRPRSPYASSKASSDLLANCYHETYDLPATVVNCSNNFGPRQHEEKLIPKIIKSLHENKPITIYGSGGQVRDWIYVEDACRAILKVTDKGRVGDRYCVGGEKEMKNLDVARLIHDIFKMDLGRDVTFHVEHTDDRPKDDRHYAINNYKIKNELDFHLTHEDFREKLRFTIDWYLKHGGIVGGD